MEYDVKKEARKQYFHYFRVWFIILGVMVVVFGLACAAAALKPKVPRTNFDAPEKHVYDYGDLLTPSEEEKLEEYIAKCEEKNQIDLVVVTVKEYMGESDYEWETAMMNYADDFYDNNNFGYDIPRGNGALLLDNRLSGQEGRWISTCGSVYEKFGNAEIDKVMDEVYAKADKGYYAAYKAFVDTTCKLMGGSGVMSIPSLFILIFPIVVAFIFAVSKLGNKQYKVTTNEKTYLMDQKTMFRNRTDDFLRKNVTHRVISSGSSGGGGGGGRSGGHGGGHVSHSGTSHGGGGRRG